MSDRVYQLPLVIRGTHFSTIAVGEVPSEVFQNKLPLFVIFTSEQMWKDYSPWQQMGNMSPTYICATISQNRISSVFLYPYSAKAARNLKA